MRFMDTALPQIGLDGKQLRLNAQANNKRDSLRNLGQTFYVHKLMQRILITLLVLLTLSLHAQKAEPPFRFDSADVEIKATLLENPLFYDAGIAPTTNGLWVAWLEFIPEKGDQLWLGLRQGEKWISKELVSTNVADYANPTPTIDSKGNLWLSYEKAIGSKWHVVVVNVRRTRDRLESNLIRFVGVNHSVSVGRDGKLLVAWQVDVNGSFQLRASEIWLDAEKKSLGVNALKDVSTGGNAWHPSTAIANDSSYLAWDAYDGTSHNIFVRKEDSDPVAIAATPAFEAHAQIASGKDGSVWIAWEEGGENWGKVYRAKEPGDEKKRYRMADQTGPLHRFRRLHFAKLDKSNSSVVEYSFPQPSLTVARSRTNAPAGLLDTGVFYERAQLAVDGFDRPWIIYRHGFSSFVGVLPETHKQENMRVYARCLLPDGWSKLFQLDLGQGDGMQRLFVTPLKDGISIAYTTGRTDRRKLEPAQRGVALAEIHLPEEAKPRMSAKREVRLVFRASANSVIKRQRPVAQVDGKDYELFYGDLHRHTDISLCFSPVDGTIDDAYRYALDAAPLDFLGITDHTHDLDMGNPLALIWHRSRKEVNRHALANHFIPFYSYERSRADTDHNVISLDENVLRPHTYALTEFWDQINTNTFTMPHAPVNPITWKYKDAAHRPLMEIYQGFRNIASEADAKQGLLRGHTFGFIASSDHLSTSASFAGVWAEKPTRESLFRAMQARRTFGATAKIQMKVTCGSHWMGERFTTNNMPDLQIDIRPTAPIKELTVFVDGEPVTDGLASDKPGNYRYAPARDLTGPHLFYVRLTQEDGNRAWSSPIWVDITK